LIVVNFYF